jgi:hypothetical protein
VVIDDFNIGGASISPDKTYAPLIVYTDRELPAPPSLQRFKSVRRRHSEIGGRASLIEHSKLSQRHRLNIRRKLAASLTGPYPLNLSIGKTITPSVIASNCLPVSVLTTVPSRGNQW